MHRFYCPDFESKSLSAAESHHAVHVLRLKQGDTISLFNGKGTEAKGEITLADKKNLSFKILTTHRSPKSSKHIHLAQAVIKAKAMDMVVQKAAELGTSSIHPVLSERSVVLLDEEKIDSKAAKWEQTAMEACKQCGQNHLPELHNPAPLMSFLDALRTQSGLKLIASLQPGAKSFHTIFQENNIESEIHDITMLIGPEGDFTPAEVSAALAVGCQPVSLGPHILRSETAAIFALSVLLHETTI